jgi:hypothetical protein
MRCFRSGPLTEQAEANHVATFAAMAAAAETRICPHCEKPFRAELLGSETARPGFKCPHCKLFVPLDRAEDAKTDAA